MEKWKEEGTKRHKYGQTQKASEEDRKDRKLKEHRNGEGKHRQRAGKKKET